MGSTGNKNENNRNKEVDHSKHVRRIVCFKTIFTVTNLSVNYGKTNETSTEEPFRYNIHVLFIYFSCFSHRYQFIHGMNSLVDQELLTLPEHLSSTPVLVGFVLLDLQFLVYVL